MNLTSALRVIKFHGELLSKEKWPILCIDNNEKH